MASIDIKRKIYGKNSFSNVVDTTFSQLIPKSSEGVADEADKISKFVAAYDDVFYDIPATGSGFSHLDIVNRSTEYLGISYTDLLEELRITRNENVSLKNQLFTLTGIK
jgi:hypothetical protein